MAITSGFFNSLAGDREYNAAHWADYFAAFISNGVFPNPSTGMQIMESSGLTVNMMAGRGFIDGYWIKNDSAYPITLDAAEPVLDRIDVIGFKLVIGTREVIPFYKKGDPSSTPTMPTPERGSEIEYILGSINMTHGKTEIAQVDITDQRLNTSVCGVVHGVVEQVDTQTIFNQYKSWWESQQDTTGYLTVAGDNPSLDTDDKKIIGAINELNSEKIGHSDVINNLTSTNTDKPLSAAQGKTLNDNKMPKTGGTFTGNVSIGGELNVGTIASVIQMSATAVHAPGGLNLALKSGDASHAPILYGVNVQAKTYDGSAFTNIVASDFNQSSSKRWKENIVTMSIDDIKKLLDVRIVNFTYKQDFTADGGCTHMGVIAEEIVNLFRDAVTLDNNDIPAYVDYSKLVIPCIGMIQQQQKKIDALTDLLVGKGLITQAEADNI